MSNTIDTKELANFLHASNKNTYANKEAAKAESTRLNSKDYHFEQGDLIYHDTYFGPRDFIGEEIIYKKEQPVWGANYFGFILDDNLHEDDVYSFLRKALMQEYSDIIPVRGPKTFTKDNWTYNFKAEGDLKTFRGE